MYAAIILGSAILALRIQDAAVMTMKEEKETVTETGIETETEKEKEKEKETGTETGTVTAIEITTITDGKETGTLHANAVKPTVSDFKKTKNPAYERGVHTSVLVFFLFSYAVFVSVFSMTEDGVFTWIGRFHNPFYKRNNTQQHKHRKHQ